MVVHKANFLLTLVGSAVAAICGVSQIRRRQRFIMAPVTGSRRNNLKLKRKPVPVNCTDAQQKKNPACCFCCRTEDEPEKYGEKMIDKKTKLSAHFTCLIFSSGLWQEGKEREGFYGFLMKDIMKEAERASEIKCCICKKMGASINCNNKKCSKSFHYPCGQEKKCIFQFFDCFRSYCWEHAPVQRALAAQGKSLCAICLDDIQPKVSYNVIKSPCCKHTWFHRLCLQKCAQSAGQYFFKCTICTNKDRFQKEMLRIGIHIPVRDASWELEENAFSELYEVHQRCDVAKCLCDKGRKYHESRSKWNIVRCHCCGSVGTHLVCSALSSSRCNWTCPDCLSIENRHRSDEAGPSRQKQTCRAPMNSNVGRVLQRVLRSNAQASSSTAPSGSNLRPRAPTNTRLTTASNRNDSRVSNTENTDRTNLRGVHQAETRRTRREQLFSKKGEKSVLKGKGTK